MLDPEKLELDWWPSDNEEKKVDNTEPPRRSSRRHSLKNASIKRKLREEESSMSKLGPASGLFTDKDNNLHSAGDSVVSCLKNKSSYTVSKHLLPEVILSNLEQILNAQDKAALHASTDNQAIDMDSSLCCLEKKNGNAEDEGGSKEKSNTDEPNEKTKLVTQNTNFDEFYQCQLCHKTVISLHDLELHEATECKTLSGGGSSTAESEISKSKKDNNNQAKPIPENTRTREQKIRTKNVPASYKCQHCEKGFATNLSLKKHASHEHKEKLPGSPKIVQGNKETDGNDKEKIECLYCFVCQEQFVCFDRLENHLMSHTGIQPAVQVQNFEYHIFGKKVQPRLSTAPTSDDKIRVYNCSECNKLFGEQNLFEKHSSICKQRNQCPSNSNHKSDIVNSDTMVKHTSDKTKGTPNRHERKVVFCYDLNEDVVDITVIQSNLEHTSMSYIANDGIMGEHGCNRNTDGTSDPNSSVQSSPEKRKRKGVFCYNSIDEDISLTESRNSKLFKSFGCIEENVKENNTRVEHRQMSSNSSFVKRTSDFFMLVDEGRKQRIKPTASTPKLRKDLKKTSAAENNSEISDVGNEDIKPSLPDVTDSVNVSPKRSCKGKVAPKKLGRTHKPTSKIKNTAEYKSRGVSLESKDENLNGALEVGSKYSSSKKGCTAQVKAKGSAENCTRASRKNVENTSRVVDVGNESDNPNSSSEACAYKSNETVSCTEQSENKKYTSMNKNNTSFDTSVKNAPDELSAVVGEDRKRRNKRTTTMTNLKTGSKKKYSVGNKYHIAKSESKNDKLCSSDEEDNGNLLMMEKHEDQVAPGKLENLGTFISKNSIVGKKSSSVGLESKDDMNSSNEEGCIKLLSKVNHTHEVRPGKSGMKKTPPESVSPIPSGSESEAIVGNDQTQSLTNCSQSDKLNAQNKILINEKKTFGDTLCSSNKHNEKHENETGVNDSSSGSFNVSSDDTLPLVIHQKDKINTTVDNRVSKAVLKKKIYTKRRGDSSKGTRKRDKKEDNSSDIDSSCSDLNSRHPASNEHLSSKSPFFSFANQTSKNSAEMGELTCNKMVQEHEASIAGLKSSLEQYRTYFCPVCACFYINAWKFSEHMLTHKVQNEEENTGTNFMQRTVSEPQSDHAVRKTFECFICGKMLMYKDNLQKHIEVHRSGLGTSRSYADKGQDPTSNGFAGHGNKYLLVTSPSQDQNCNEAAFILKPIPPNDHQCYSDDNDFPLSYLPQKLVLKHLRGQTYVVKKDDSTTIDAHQGSSHSVMNKETTPSKDIGKNDVRKSVDTLEHSANEPSTLSGKLDEQMCYTVNPNAPSSHLPDVNIQADFGSCSSQSNKTECGLPDKKLTASEDTLRGSKSKGNLLKNKSKRLTFVENSFEIKGKTSNFFAEPCAESKPKESANSLRQVEDEDKQLFNSSEKSTQLTATSPVNIPENLNQCIYCSKSFKTYLSFAKHMSSVHIIPPSADEHKLSQVKMSKKSHQCKLCPREYRSSSSLKRHILNVHGDLTEPNKFGKDHCGSGDWRFSDEGMPLFSEQFTKDEACKNKHVPLQDLRGSSSKRKVIKKKCKSPTCVENSSEIKEKSGKFFIEPLAASKPTEFGKFLHEAEVED